MARRIEVHVYQVWVRGDGDPMGSADMRFTFKVDGAILDLGEWKNVSSGRRIAMNHRLVVDEPQDGTLTIGFHLLDEDDSDDHGWGGADETAYDEATINIRSNPVPRIALAISAEDGDLGATAYYNLNHYNGASSYNISNYVRVYEHANAYGDYRDLNHDVPGPAIAKHVEAIACEGSGFALVTAMFESKSLHFPDNFASSIVLPGNSQVIMFDEPLVGFRPRQPSWGKGEYLYFDGQKGDIVNLSDYKKTNQIDDWNDKVTTFRTDSLYPVRAVGAKSQLPFVRVFSEPDGRGEWFDLDPSAGLFVWKKVFFTASGIFILEDHDFVIGDHLRSPARSLLLNRSTCMIASRNQEISGHYNIAARDGEMFNLSAMPYVKKVRKPDGSWTFAQSSWDKKLVKIRASRLYKG